MTTPQTPAGWYSDPDGLGGQRYWDGHTWTEHRAAAPQFPPPSSQRRGAHRAPEPEDVPPTPAQPTKPVQFAAIPVGAVEDSTLAGASGDESAPSDATTVIPTSPPAASGPPGGADRQLLTRYLAVCTALLAVLVAVAVYAAFFADDGSTTIDASDDATTSETATPTTTEDDAPTETATETATETPTEAPPAETGDPTDGTLAFTVHGIEVEPTVVSADAPVEKTAVGEFVVVHMTVTNIGDTPVTFLGVFQKLNAGGTVYSADSEATFYTGGGLIGVNPGERADVAVAFDVPPGTAPESIELHGDPTSPGIEVPLS